MESEEYAGATPNERLKEAARADDEKTLLEIFDHPGTFDINHQDGAGNTALHYAAKHGSLDVLEYILSHEECDVDPINRLGETPLHLAISSTEIDEEDSGLREEVVESLLDAGADVTIEDAGGRTATSLSAKNKAIKSLLQKAQLNATISKDDIADDDEDGYAGSGSGSDDN
ncbi:hypothetical protein PILCRDRAFT_475462 [Piloderma croceum F 1598]|uniref:Peptidase A2 domain-containing protein n=1 Tax=Piloderma croceum (strain F 1598) TaxID=765440 RepID=A0A0C3FCH1_PILCF|nr:hypothetical protein PILCRDRAFT_475462 [Piloderma croceum F 1598]